MRSYEGRGRARPDDEECPLRTPFQRDRDRIVHCKAFRRLKHKTQVFIAPEGDHFRTRLTHTLEVSGISRGVARALRLNEDLAEAIALGHDLGHAPFGHSGEEALDNVLEAEHGRRFRHNQQSLRVVEHLERDGEGLNLTWEVRDGILNHTGEGEPATLEGAIVRLVDRFAYVNHDIDDALRAGILDYGELPAAPLELLGGGSSERIDALVHDLVETSDVAGAIAQSPVYRDALLELREFMFDRVYLSARARAETHPGRRDGRVGLPLLPGPSRRDGRGLRRRRHPSDRLGLGHDRSLLHAGVRRPDRSMSKIKRESVEAVKDAVDMLDLVSGYTQLRGGGGELLGPLPIP